jgi:hypothetical protein
VKKFVTSVMKRVLVNLSEIVPTKVTKTLVEPTGSAPAAAAR